jgi:tellurite resistance protein
MATHVESLICALIMVSAADRQMGDRELRQIGRYVKHLPAFAAFDQDQLTDVARKVTAVLAGDNGLENGLTFVRDGLPPRLRETAYVLACEVAAADPLVPLEERRVLQLLRQHLEIDRLVAAAIERSTLARYAEAIPDA